MEKLILAQDTSNVENTEISSNELNEHKKREGGLKQKKNCVILILRRCWKKIKKIE